MSDPARLTPEQQVNEIAQLWLAFRAGETNAAATFNAFEVADRLAAELSRLRELLEQAEVDTERKVDAELRGRLEKAEAALAVAHGTIFRYEHAGGMEEMRRLRNALAVAEQERDQALRLHTLNAEAWEAEAMELQDERDVARRALGEACEQYRLEHDLCNRYRDALERIKEAPHQENIAVGAVCPACMAEVALAGLRAEDKE